MKIVRALLVSICFFGLTACVLVDEGEQVERVDDVSASIGIACADNYDCPSGQICRGVGSIDNPQCIPDSRPHEN